MLSARGVLHLPRRAGKSRAHSNELGIQSLPFALFEVLRWETWQSLQLISMLTHYAAGLLRIPHLFMPNADSPLCRPDHQVGKPLLLPRAGQMQSRSQ